ncbi:TetR/AcrR family transcriptional regulator [Solimonas soli]|uniref:TetR/AcrR family transcriptional regulator n=1 Tax=Solimonas soli TaxID=413479 RepID=UPI000487D046|nr:TetR/AcrR family transcriptional regulator [Solimonas soli]
MALKKAKSAGAKPRRRRDPDGTRTAILQAAGTLLAKDGPQGLSVSQVAQLAGVNRGTAYQHFQTREQLVEATTGWVSEQLCQAAFGKTTGGKSSRKPSPEEQARLVDPRSGVIEHIVEFAMENPELARAWLFHVLASPQPAHDPFWKMYRQRFEEYVKTDSAQPGIDVEVHTVLMLVGTFLWPVWARAHARTAKERQQLALRFTEEIARLSLYGTMRPEKYPKLVARLSKRTQPKPVAAKSGRAK